MLDLGRGFLASVERSPEAITVIDGAARFTYGQWFDTIRRVAGGLAGLGIGKGDHLLVVLQNRWEMATLHCTCQFLGVIATPLLGSDCCQRRKTMTVKKTHTSAVPA